MAPVAARRTDTEEEEEAFEGEELELAQPATPAVSDSRRRRQLKRGEVPQEAPPPPVRKERPTPSHREEHHRSRNVVIRSFQGLREYAHEVSVELRKVSWPTREETMRLTYIVIAVTIFFAFFLGLISFLFSVLATQLATTDNVLAIIIVFGLVIGVAGLWLFRDRIWGGRLE